MQGVSFLTLHAAYYAHRTRQAAHCTQLTAHASHPCPILRPLRSAPPNSIYCFENWGNQLVDFIEEKIQESTTIVANSVGGEGPHSTCMGPPLQRVVDGEVRIMELVRQQNMMTAGMQSLMVNAAREISHLQQLRSQVAEAERQLQQLRMQPAAEAGRGVQPPLPHHAAA